MYKQCFGCLTFDYHCLPNNLGTLFVCFFKIFIYMFRESMSVVLSVIKYIAYASPYSYLLRRRPHSRPFTKGVP